MNIIYTKRYDKEVLSFVVYRLANDKYISYKSDLYQEHNKIIVD